MFGNCAVHFGNPAVACGNCAVVCGSFAVHCGNSAVVCGNDAVRFGNVAVYCGNAAHDKGKRAFVYGNSALCPGNDAFCGRIDKIRSKRLNMKLIFFAFILLMITISNDAQSLPPIEAGVSQTLARWRAANYSDVRYKLNITLEKGAPLMKGEIEIRVSLSDEGAKNDLILDWRTTQFQNDKDKPFAFVTQFNEISAEPDKVQVPIAKVLNEHLILPKQFLKMGENVIKIQFASPIKTSGAAVTRYVDKEDGAEYVYSLFVPSDASTAFPVFDQPDLKAKFQLHLNVPHGWKAVSNSAEEDFGAEFVDNNGKPVNRIFSFEITQPISPYVFAFAAGEFEEFRGKNADVNLDNYPPNLNESLETRAVSHSRTSTMNIYVRKSQAEKFKQHADEVFRLNREGVKFLESYFDYKFPFPKYDLVLIPEFPFGGMEHAGATFLREDRVIFPTEPTKNDYITRANVIFHEAAHQWFGDTVTMRWFDDLWLKEGFAEFMAYKTLEKVLPEYNAWKVFYERNKQAAYLTDVTRGTTPIYQEIPNLASAKSAYGNIVYRKAPSFLRQAEFYLGEKEFQTAVRAFLKKHEFANAEWTDLVKEFETASKQDLKDWANVWVKQPGLGNFSVGVERIPSQIGADGIGYSLQQLIIPKMNSYWQQELKILIIPKNGKRKIHNFTFGGVNVGGDGRTLAESFLVIQRFRPQSVTSNFEPGYPGSESLLSQESPIAVFPNYQDYGYGIFLLDEKSRDYVLKNIQNEKDDFLRSMMWGSLWDSVRFYELAPEEYVRLVIKNINVEQDESTIQTLLGRVGTAMNYYLSEPSAVAGGSGVTRSSTSRKQNPPATADGSDLARRLETVLTERIANAKTAGQRITFYRAYLNLASSAAAQKNLKDILAGKSKLAVFQLKTKDKFDIVTRLLILGDRDAPALLANLEKTETSDDAKRYAYAARAGIGSPETKAKYFKDFLTDKNISESWIESAFVPFNSPRHSDLTLQYLETALAELPNLKRTRKIFFVNGWLGAFLGGQKSPEALAIVNKFLADNQNLDKDLRLKIMENADNLERAVKIREKFGK